MLSGFSQPRIRGPAGPQPKGLSRCSRTVLVVTACRAQGSGAGPASGGAAAKIRRPTTTSKPQPPPKPSQQPRSKPKAPVNSNSQPGKQQQQQPGATGSAGRAAAAAASAPGKAGHQRSTQRRTGQAEEAQHTRPRQNSSSQQQQGRSREAGAAGSSATRSGKQGKGKPGGVDSRVLTSKLKAATSPEQLLLVVQRHAADLNHIHLSAAFTQAARLFRQGVAPQRQPAAEQQLLFQLHQLAAQPSLQEQCGARQLANIIHSSTKLCSPNTARLLLPLFLQPSRLQEAAPQAVSNTLWAAATLQLELTAVHLQQLLDRLTAVLPDASPQAVSNTLWTVATMGQQVPKQQLQLLLGRLIAVLPDAKPQAVSNTLWAVATMGQQVPTEQLQQLLQRFTAVLPYANLQHVSNTLWAVATMGQQVPPQQLQQLLQRFTALLPDANSQDVSNTLWACGKQQHLPLQLLEQLQKHPQQLEQLLADANPQHVANMAWACGQLGYRSQLLPGELLQQAVQLLQQEESTCSGQSWCNLCWSAAVLDLQQFVPQVLQLAAAAGQVFSTASDEGLQQLHQVHLWLLDSQLPAPAQGLSGVLTQQQLEQCRASWEQSMFSTARRQSSRLQQSVYAAVQQLPPGTWQQPPQLEQATDDKVCLVDIASVTAAGVQIAIEVDGPDHFVQPGNTLTGTTQFRNRALAARGYAVISIPHWEWRPLCSAGQQQQYLLATLQQAVQHQPAAAAAAQPAATAAAAEVAAAAVNAVRSSRRPRRVRRVKPTNLQGM